METSMMINAMLQSALYPMLAAGAVTLLLCKVVGRTERDYITAIGLCAGFVTGFFAISGFASFPPLRVADWTPYVVITATLLFSLFSGRKLIFRLAAAALFILAMSWLYLRPLLRSWSTTQDLSWMAVCSSLLLLLWLAWEWAGPKPQKRELPLLMVVIATGASVVTLIGSSAKLAQISGALAASCGALFLVSFVCPKLKLGSAAIGVFLTALAGQLINAHFYVEVSWIALCLIYISGFAILLTRLPRLARLSMPLRSGVVLAAALVPIVIAVLLMVFAGSQEDPYDYY